MTSKIGRTALIVEFCFMFALPCAASEPRLLELGHGPGLASLRSVEPTEGPDCFRRPANPMAAFRLEDLREFITWRFQEEYDPWFRDESGILHPDSVVLGAHWSRLWIGGLSEVPTEVFEYPTGAEIIRFDTMQTWFAKDHTDVPAAEVPRHIDEHARIVCNGNFVLFFLEYDWFGEKKKREADLFVRFFKEFTPRWHRNMKESRRNLDEWTDLLVRGQYEDALTRIEDRAFPPAGHPELYAELKEVENEIAVKIEHLQWLRGLARGQILRLARLRDRDDLLAWKEYNRIAEVGDFGTLRQLYDLAISDAPDTPLLRSAAARLMIRLPGDDFDTVPIEFVPEYERAIASASKSGELDSLWRNFGIAERISLHEIRRFRDYAVVEVRFSKDLGRASFTSGGAWVLLDRSDSTCSVCEIIETWFY